MKSPAPRIGALFLLLPAPTGAQQATPLLADTLLLRSGVSVACRILQAGDMEVKIEYWAPTEGRNRNRDVPWHDIRAIDFAMDDEFRSLLASTNITKDGSPMLARWRSVEHLLSRPHHPAGDLGLVIARLAVASGDKIVKRRALEVCSKVAHSDWDSGRRDSARWMRVQLLDSLGLFEEARAEADVLAKNRSIVPSVAMDANLYLATTKLNSLKKLEAENPRWMEDDLVRPEREALFHSALDHFLKPSLFQGSIEDAAVRGLWGAVELLALDGDVTGAAGRARDILKLYPNCPTAAKAANFLVTRDLPLEQDGQAPLTQAKDDSSSDHPPDREPIVRRRERYSRQPPTPPAP